MFLEYYSLGEQPFGVTPDPRFLYLDRMYREALASLWYGVKQGRGFMALIAPPGMGKTTLLFHLLQRLRAEAAQTAFLFQTCCNPVELIRYLLQDLGVFPATDLASMHQQLNEALARQARAGKQFVFVIDEAQNLSSSVLETVRLLSDFETPDGKLLQIILAGQPQLLRTLVQPEMLQLRQRVSITTTLVPLNVDEVCQYVAHRLRIAGYKGSALFTRRALEVVARESSGIPRNINNLCFASLSLGFVLRRTHIDETVVEEAATDQNLEVLQKRLDSYLAPPQACRNAPVTAKLHSHHSSWHVGQRRKLTYLGLIAGLLLAGDPSPKPRVEPELSRNVAATTDTLFRKSKSDQVVTAAGNLNMPPQMLSSRTVTVLPGDNLRRICLAHLGRYSTRIVENLQALNPQLTDPNNIAVGQEIRLPMNVWSRPAEFSDGRTVVRGASPGK